MTCSPDIPSLGRSVYIPTREICGKHFFIVQRAVVEAQLQLAIHFLSIGRKERKLLLNKTLEPNA